MFFNASSLTTGIDNLTGSAGDDTFVGSKADGTNYFTSLDAIDGGEGSDSLNITVTAAFDSTAAAAATVKNVEIVNITSTGAVTANSTAWNGTETLVATSGGALNIDAAATTDVVATSTNLNTSAAVDGARNVTLTAAESIDIDAAGTSGTITVGAASAVKGAVTVTHTEAFSDGGAGGADTGAGSTIAVTGGTSVTVNSLASLGAKAGAHTDVATIGAVTVTGTTDTTTVSISQTAAANSDDTAGKPIDLANGNVTVNDVNRTEAAKAGSITSVTLNNFAAATVNSGALETLTLSGKGTSVAAGTLGALTVPAITSLNLNVNGLTTTGAVTLDTDVKTLNIDSSTAKSTINSLSAASAATVNIGGDALVTLTGQTFAAKAVITVTNTAGASLGTALGNEAMFTGGAGADSVSIGATKKAIATGAGDDTVTIGATALSTGGSVDAGEGDDTLKMSDANAVTASAATTFEATISNFEKLELTGTTAADQTVNLANLDSLNAVKIAGVNTGNTLTLSNASSGLDLTANAGAAGTLAATLANTGTADVVSLSVTDAANTARTVGGLSIGGFETLNVSVNDKADTTATAHIITTLTAADLTTLNVSGNAGLTFTTATSATKLTTLDAATLGGALSITTGALTTAATLTGGAGADTINAAAATKAVTINGGAGNDASLVGSATKSSTINGDAGNDALTGGAAADVINGGDGTDTFVFSSANIVEQAGSGTTSGVAINIGSSDVSQSAVFTAMSNDYLASTSATLAAGTAAYLYTTESTTNAVVIDTLVSIENVTGSNGDDFIVGSDANNVLKGGLGADVVTGGKGDDDFVLSSGLTIDSITDFTTGSDDALFDLSDLETAGATIAATTIDFVEIFDNNSVAAGSVGLQTLTAAAAAVDGANVFLIDVAGTTYANAAAAVDALETGGAAALSFAGNIAADDGFIFAYEKTGGGIGIAVANFAAADDNSGGAAATGAGNLESADLATLVGINDVTKLVAADFAFIG